MTECPEEGVNELRSSGIVAHVNDVRPVGVTVHDDEEVLPCIRAKIHCNFLEWSGWSRLHDDWLLPVLINLPSWQVVQLQTLVLGKQL